MFLRYICLLLKKTLKIVTNQNKKKRTKKNRAIYFSSIMISLTKKKQTKFSLS